MKHLAIYAKQKFAEKDINDLFKISEGLVDDAKYNAKELKRKWTSFWDWIFGEDSREELKYNPFSDDYDESAFKKMFKNNDDSQVDCIIKWIKIDSDLNVNRKKVNELLKQSDEKTNKGFWRTSNILKMFKVKPSTCAFILGEGELKTSGTKTKNAAILITVYSKQILSVDVIKEYKDIIYWQDILKYLKSAEFKKNLFDENVSIEGNIHPDFEKYFKKLFKLKQDQKTKLYKFEVEDRAVESIDVENIAWKVDKYFGKKTAQYDNFVKLVEKFREQHAISDEDIQEFLTKSKIDLKKFIDFICEDIDTAEQRDYMYLLRKTVQSIIDDKTITL